MKLQGIFLILVAALFHQVLSNARILRLGRIGSSLVKTRTRVPIPPSLLKWLNFRQHVKNSLNLDTYNRFRTASKQASFISKNLKNVVELVLSMREEPSMESETNGPSWLQTNADSKQALFSPISKPEFSSLSPVRRAIVIVSLKHLNDGHHHNNFNAYPEFNSKGYRETCMPPMIPKFGRLSCNATELGIKCHAACQSGYSFPNGADLKENECLHVEGVWKPTKNFETCQPKDVFPPRFDVVSTQTFISGLEEMFSLFDKVWEKKSFTILDKLRFESIKFMLKENVIKSCANSSYSTNSDHVTPFSSFCFPHNFSAFISEFRSFQHTQDSKIRQLEKKFGHALNGSLILHSDPNSELLNSNSKTGTDEELDTEMIPGRSLFHGNPMSTVSHPKYVHQLNSFSTSPTLRTQSRSSTDEKTIKDALNNQQKSDEGKHPLANASTLNKTVVPEMLQMNFLKRHNVPVEGAKNSSHFIIIPKSPTRNLRRILVNRFEPQTTCNYIIRYLSDSNVTFDCVKLRTRNMARYASFVLSCSRDVLQQLIKPDFWPNGIYVKEFFGTPRYILKEEEKVQKEIAPLHSGTWNVTSTESLDFKAATTLDSKGIDPYDISSVSVPTDNSTSVLSEKSEQE